MLAGDAVFSVTFPPGFISVRDQQGPMLIGRQSFPKWLKLANSCNYQETNARRQLIVSSSGLFDAMLSEMIKEENRFGEQ